MKRSFRRTLGAALALALALTVFAPLEVLAVSQSQIDALEAERDELSAEREEMEAGIAELEAEHADIMERKTALDERNELYRQEIELIEEQVELYTSLVEQKKLEVDSALERENEQLANYRRHVRAMEENGSFTWLAIIFGSKSLGELLSNIDMVGEIMEADRRSYEQYRRARGERARAGRV